MMRCTITNPRLFLMMVLAVCPEEGLRLNSSSADCRINRATSTPVLPFLSACLLTADMATTTGYLVLSTALTRVALGEVPTSLYH